MSDDESIGANPTLLHRGKKVGGSTGRSDRWQKKHRKLEFESTYLDNLPSSGSYEWSYMHRDVVTHIVVSKPSDFVVTASLDGQVKFWKKVPKGIEFVKHFQVL